MRNRVTNSGRTPDSNRYRSSGSDSRLVQPSNLVVYSGFTYSTFRPVSGISRTTGCSGPSAASYSEIDGSGGAVWA